MSSVPPDKWRLEDLAALASSALEGEELEGESRRVQWLPGPRTARYYTTLGLLDRPARLEGRTAFYGRRHLLQLVCIKRLQSRGLSLEAIQHRLVGLPDPDLERLAGLPAGILEAPPRTAGEGPLRRDQGARFWERSAAALDATRDADRPRVSATVVLAEGVRLVLDVAPERLDAARVEALARAARPLLRLLEENDRAPSPEKPESNPEPDEPLAAGRKESEP